LNVSASWRRAWRAVVAMTLIGFAGCGGVQAPGPPALHLPPGCIDEFSGYAHRGCL
jgi:hypothetical protein